MPLLGGFQVLTTGCTLVGAAAPFAQALQELFLYCRRGSE